MNLKIVMVEGAHDGAFISKIMQVYGYKTYSKPIGEYHPNFISSYLTNQYKQAPVDQLNLQSVRQQILFPSYSLVSENKEEILLIFQMGGDSRKDRRQKLVGDLFRFLNSPITTEAVSDSGKVTFIYEFDADEVGIEARLSQSNQEIRLTSPSFPGLNSNGSYEEHQGIRWGVYIFADANGRGKLEDIILPLMEKENDDVAKCAMDFVNRRASFSLFQKVKPTSHPLKARVGVMGQLEKAGAPNSAIIEQSSFLTEEKIKCSSICEELFHFLAG